MNIYLTEIKDGGTKFTFPSLPQSISLSGSANYRTYEIINSGTIQIPKGTNVNVISWDGVFFGESRKSFSFISSWNPPRSCQSILEGWRDKGIVLRLMVTDTNINYDVTIQSFDCEASGGQGDINYSISFAFYKDLKVMTTEELGIAPPPVETRPEPKTGETYTVVSGDNLWKIARIKLGSGARWQEIYNANKDVIEASAKKHGKSSSSNGHWIWPGDTYTLPVA